MLVLDLKTKLEYEINVNKTGENTIVCPVCSHTRKKKTDKCFGYNVQKGAGRCNHCGVVLVEKKEFEQKRTQIEYKRPEYKKLTQLSLKLVEWFIGRSISEKTLFELNIGEGFEFMPQIGKKINTVHFNYFKFGELVNVKYRDGAKNFKLFKDAEKIFYNIDAVIGAKEVVIVEGEMDVLSLWECGIKNVISVPNGATASGKINMDYLDNCIDFFDNDCKFILATDNDSVGLRLRDEMGRRLGYENCSYVTFKNCKDANECLVKYGVGGVLEALNDKTEFPIVGVFNANDIKENIYDFYKNGMPKGCGIGIAEFDKFLRFHESYITTITGIPGHGKSEFLDFLLCRLNISHGWKSALYSPENHPLELHFSKFAEKIIGKPFEGINRISNFELEALIKYHSENFYFINPENDFTLKSILDSVKQLVRKKGVNSFVIDAWNKLDHQYTGSETQYISKALDELVKFCERNKVHCFLVAHPTKITKNKDSGSYEVPNLYSISGSANFYNKTANGITVYRNYDTGMSEIHIQKVKFKHWGETGCVHFSWDKTNGRYYKGYPSYEPWISINNAQVVQNNDFLNQSQIIINNIEDPF
jgi:twinkle protein